MFEVFMEEVIEKLKLILKKYKFFHWYSWSDRYFVMRKSVKKMAFYFYEKKNFVIFWLSFQWTAILDEYLMLKVTCDEIWKSTLKWKIYSLGDIERKWIPNIVEVVAKYFWVII